MKTRVIIVSLAVGAVLSGCSYSQQKPLATRAKASVGRRPSGRRITYQGNGLVRVPDQTHVYKVGRLPDGDSMREAGKLLPYRTGRVLEPLRTGWAPSRDERGIAAERGDRNGGSGGLPGCAG